MAAAQQAARVTDPVTHGLGVLGILGGMLVGVVAGAILIAALPVTAPALVVGLTVAAGVGAVAGGGLAGHQLLAGIQRACALPSPTTGLIGTIGSPNVRIGQLPAARVIADMATACHGLYTAYHPPIPPLPPAPIAEGAQTIRINNLLAARVGSKVVCGAAIQSGALTVYYGGPTKSVLAVIDMDAVFLAGLGFLAKASLIAMGLLTIPLGFAAIATLALIFGGFMAVNYGLGLLGDQIGPGWRDLLQGGFGLVAIVGGAKLGAKALEKSALATKSTEVSPQTAEKILRGARNSKGDLIGVHSAEVLDHPDFATNVLKTNPDGTVEAEILKRYPDGTLSGVKKSTLAPKSWSNAKIISTTEQVGDAPPVGTRSHDGATCHMGEVDGVKWVTIKDRSGNVTAGYPNPSGAKPGGFK